MTLDFDDQREDSTLPLRVCNAFTGSQLALDLVGVPVTVNAGDVTAVTVTITNADGNTSSVNAEKVMNGQWRATFNSSFFETYGFVSNGVKVVATIVRDDESTDHLVIGMGDINIKASTSSAQPGSTKKTFEEKGAESYIRTKKINGVQHYVKQVMSYDAEIGWGADWTGDYILVNGEFVEAN